MDWWINGKGINECVMDEGGNPFLHFEISPMNYTVRRNLNRGYMKLDVWQRGIDLFKFAFELAGNVADFKLKSQFTDAAQSVSANVAEGYGRRTLAEYIQFLYTAKGSLGESLTRALGLWQVQLLNNAQFEEFDKLHYEVENKLLGLIASLECKRGSGEWVESLPISPQIHQTINPLIQ